MEKPVVLIIDHMHESIVPLLEQAGFVPDYRPGIQREELLEILPSFHGLVVRSKTPIDEEVVNRASKLRVVARAGAGLDQIDMDALQTKGIEVINSPEGNRDALAEHMMGMLLMLYNRLGHAHAEIKQGKWRREPNRGLEVKGKVVGLVGFGNMGSAFTKRLQGFDCEVIAYDKYKSGYGSVQVEEVDMTKLFDRADIVSFHVPLTSETRQMVNKSYINRFKKPVTLLNSARGEIINHRDLLNAIKDGKVVGACLDVFENENFKRLSPKEKDLVHELSHHPAVIMTPHVAGWSQESNIRINEILVGKMQKLSF